MIEQNEATIKAKVRLAASKRGWKLFRNNTGVLPDKRGVPVRFGLNNDTPQINKLVKMPDLVGWRSVVITPDMVGTTIAQFVGVETKRGGWKYNANDEHEVAQKRGLDMINAAGGFGVFNSTGEL